jgi:hypothetical protein
MNVFKLHSHLVLMLEYLAGGDLKHFLIKRKKLVSEDTLESGLTETEVIIIMQ